MVATRTYGRPTMPSLHARPSPSVCARNQTSCPRAQPGTSPQPPSRASTSDSGPTASSGFTLPSSSHPKLPFSQKPRRPPSPPKSYGRSPCSLLSRPFAHALHHVRRLASSSMPTQLPFSGAHSGAAAIKPCAARVYQRPFATT